MGLFYYRCIDLETGEKLNTDSSTEVCGNMSCPTGFICVNSLDNPAYGLINFDNVIFAFLQCFIAITEEGWTKMSILGQTSLSVPISIIYFITLVFLGSFLMLSLIEVVLYSNFSREMEKVRLKQQKVGTEIEEESFDSSLVGNLGQDEDSLLKEDINDIMVNQCTGSDPEVYLIKKSQGDELSEKKLEILSKNNRTLKMQGISKPVVLKIDYDISSDIIENLSNEDSDYSPKMINTKNLNESFLSPHFRLETTNCQALNFKISTDNKGSEILREQPIFADDSISIDLKRFQNNSQANTGLVSDSRNKSESRKYNAFNSRRNSSSSATGYQINIKGPPENSVAPVINRVKNLKIKKNLHDKLKKGQSSAKIKISIDEKYEISYESLYDVLPAAAKTDTELHINLTQPYIFAYRGGQSVLSDLETLTHI